MERGAQASDDNFNTSGPKHLISIDWTDLNYRTAVAAALVKGVYTLEQDRQEKREGDEALAKDWWEFFHFSLQTTLTDRSRPTIYGAVFEYNPILYDSFQNTPHLGIPPRYVIAFRGTMLKQETWFPDLKLGFNCIVDKLHERKRFKHAIVAVKSTVDKYGDKTGFLAGHSLGACMALLAGKTMAMSESGCPLEAYIFNPPTTSILLKLLKYNELKSLARFVGNIVIAGIVKALGYDEGEDEVSFRRLASWTPYLYVNRSDPICSEYINHFKHNTQMSEGGAEEILKLATRFTKHLNSLPSADLRINTIESSNRLRAHALQQWWIRGLILKCELYQLQE